MSYFAKYTLVEGEIKEGDFFVYMGKVWQCQRSDAEEFDFSSEVLSEKCRKVQLSLCTTDIKAGDNILFPDKTGYNPEIEYVATTDKIKGDEAVPVSLLDWAKENGAFKVIGEIMTPGIKEGQTFTEKTVDYLTVK